ncbi:MAG: amidohydrolase family protein, partial [Bauldia sp.]
GRPGVQSGTAADVAAVLRVVGNFLTVKGVPSDAAGARALLDAFPLLVIDREIADLAADLRREHGWRLPDAIQAAVRERAARTPAGEWVVGFKYDDTKTRDGRPLSRADLDLAAPNHPVLIEHRGGHTAYCNSAAFRLAGVSAATADPPGGKIDRDERGEPAGRLAETAVGLVERHVPVRSTPADRQAGVKLISQMLAKAGITSVHDASASVADFRAYQDARAAGELGTRVYVLVYANEIDRIIAAGLRQGSGDDWVRLGGMKTVCDGSISERTARLAEPYVGRPTDFGILVNTPEQLWPQLEKAHRAGLQIGVHANGDVGIDLVLDLYERLQREAPRTSSGFTTVQCSRRN